jgi:type VI secretion system protein ImpA
LLALDDLLQPIDATELSGRDLRYDPLMDRIQEARVEEDDSLPMGDWARQPKRADYPLVASLASEALKKHSKDLWLAVWFGEASIHLEGYSALDSVLRLLLEVQQRFWPSIHPLLEDVDGSLRAAPLHWALNEYAALTYRFPVTEDRVTYEAYKATKSRATAEPNADAITPEVLESSIGTSRKDFFVDVEQELAKSLTSLRELQLFCDEQYGGDSPSFVKLRTALEEVHNVLLQLLRQKQLEEPEESVEVIPDGPGFVSEPAVEPDEGANMGAVSELSSVVSPSDASPDVPVRRSQRGAILRPESWEEAMRLVENCGIYCLDQQPQSPVALLLALAFEYGRRDLGGAQSSSPSSECRLALKRASESGDWNALLKQALRATMQDYGRPWLDLYQYIWRAAHVMGATTLEDLILARARGWMENDPALSEATFEDGTPLANRETRSWFENEVNPSQRTADRTSETVPPAPVEALLPGPEKDEPYAEARRLAERGEIAQAARVLMEDVSAFQSGRGSFLRRLDICRLCVQAGYPDAVNSILRRLLAEVDERGLEMWEDRNLLGELLVMLLQSLGGGEEQNERKAVYARLCHTHPAMALTMQHSN